MKSRFALSHTAACLLALLVIFAPACSVPLAPGYTILQEKREVSYTGGSSPELKIHSEFLIENTGTTPLSFVDVKLPHEEQYGRKNARVEAEGREAALEQLPEEDRQDSPDTWRIPLGAPFNRGDKIRLAIDYDLSAPTVQDWRITIGEDNFHLGSRRWAAELQPPHHVLSPNPKRPKQSTYTVRVPAGFQVIARGTLKKKQENNGEWAYTFELDKGDLAPFVVSGKYQRTPPGAGESEPVFWTISPPAGDVSAAQKQLQQAWDTMKTEFGPLDRNFAAPVIVESPELQSGNDAVGGEAVGFPGGALAASGLFSKGVGSREFLDEVSLALARDWFGDEIHPPEFAAISMGEGLPRYATIVMSEARDGEAGRRQRVEDYLARYDAACRAGAETPLGVVRESDALEVRQIARAKAPLFYVALEDTYGEKQVRAGLRQMVTLLRGQEAGVDVMRSALEQSTGKNLAEIFRVWLYQKGIPDDFRTRYESAQKQTQ